MHAKAFVHGEVVVHEDVDDAPRHAPRDALQETNEIGATPEHCRHLDCRASEDGSGCEGVGLRL